MPKALRRLMFRIIDYSAMDRSLSRKVGHTLEPAFDVYVLAGVGSSFLPLSCLQLNRVSRQEDKEAGCSLPPWGRNLRFPRHRFQPQIFEGRELSVNKNGKNRTEENTENFRKKNYVHSMSYIHQWSIYDNENISERMTPQLRITINFA